MQSAASYIDSSKPGPSTRWTSIAHEMMRLVTASILSSSASWSLGGGPILVNSVISPSESIQSQCLAAFCFRDKWKRGENVFELCGRQLIQLRDACVQLGERARVW